MENRIKKWKTQSVKHKVAVLLMVDGVSFSYNEENGIMFSASDEYVTRMVRRLMNSYGVSVRPFIQEVK